MISASGWHLGGRAAELDLGPGPHLVEGDEHQDGGRDDRPDHLEPLAAVEVLGLADRLALGVELVGEAYDAQTRTIWVPMKTMPVIQRMMMNRLSISRPKVEITCVRAARQGQPPVGRERGVDESQHARIRRPGRTGHSSNARKRSLRCDQNRCRLEAVVTTRSVVPDRFRSRWRPSRLSAARGHRRGRRRRGASLSSSGS